jgi:hypothetical protein
VFVSDPNSVPASPSNCQVIVPLSPALKLFLDQQAELEGKTPAQILIAALLRTYNPHSAENSPPDGE